MERATVWADPAGFVGVKFCEHWRQVRDQVSNLQLDGPDGAIALRAVPHETLCHS